MIDVKGMPPERLAAALAEFRAAEDHGWNMRVGRLRRRIERLERGTAELRGLARRIADDALAAL
ncbi:MAG: hypothetical protein OXH75_15670 [Acidobacteria bacterium]|nr:hypothetical protein [Acidobacteriota bacterium]